ncbi:MurR/RpiR family transcriptional regulator [Paenibacillus ihuae]|uniref:MurR/RpiR family transcriptional regulator n=1 Tax=Paenibacillus ihuae TaxID=1232431 RepID=UPI0006D5738C|nr:MurR/RpiR family transcriptional regulator [Paenibacillus ihuae]
MYKDWNRRPFSPNQRVIADFIQKNELRVLYMTEQEMADELHISIASVSRFWKAAGYRHAKDFKNSLRFRFESTPSEKMRDAMQRTGGSSLPQMLLEVASHHLQETSRYLNEALLQRAVEALSNAKHIYIYSPGPCVGLAELMAYRMARYGLNLKRMAPSGHELMEALMHAGKKRCRAGVRFCPAFAGNGGHSRLCARCGLSRHPDYRQTGLSPLAGRRYCALRGARRGVGISFDGRTDLYHREPDSRRWSAQ